MEFDKLTKKQKLFIETLSQAYNGDSTEKQAKKIGISLAMYKRWKRDPQLLRIAYHEYKKDIIPRLPKVFTALVTKAEEGDINAIKMVFQQLENFQETPSDSAELTADDIIRIVQEEQQKKT